MWHEAFIPADENTNLECMLDIKAGDVACADLAPAAKCKLLASWQSSKSSLNVTDRLHHVDFSNPRYLISTCTQYHRIIRSRLPRCLISTWFDQLTNTQFEGLQQVSVEELAELVTDCGVVSLDSHELADEFLKHGFIVTGDGQEGRIVLHKAECKPCDHDLERMQSLVVDAYAPYSPKSFKAHPFAQDLVRDARILAPQQIIMQSPSEQEFMQTVEDLVTHEKCEQEVYADVRFRAAYTRLVDVPRLELHLMLEEVQFGVTQTLNDKNTRGHFVYRIEIKVSPSEKWAHHCTQIFAKPVAEEDTFALQRHNTLGVTERLSKLSLPELSEEEVQSHRVDRIGQDDVDVDDDDVAVVKHRWMPAVFNPASAEKSVEWGWKMNAWGDGQVFCEEDPANCALGSNVPELPFTNPEVIRFRDLEEISEATWEVPCDMVKTLHGRLDWNFEIKVYTTCVQQVPLRVGKDVVVYRKKSQRVAAKFKGKTSRSNALIIPPPS